MSSCDIRCGRDGGFFICMLARSPHILDALYGQAMAPTVFAAFGIGVAHRSRSAARGGPGGASCRSGATAYGLCCRERDLFA